MKEINKKKYLTLDWGGTFIKYALVDEEGNILEKNKVPSVSRQETKENFYQLLDEIVKQYSGIDGIAISSAGVIDSKEGIIHTIGIFPFLNKTNVAKELSSRYHIKVTIENDGKCAALSEVWLGNLKDVQDGAVIILGTSIGGALMLDHKLRRGKHFLAGEFCSMCIDFDEIENVESYVGQRCCTPYLCDRIQTKMHLSNKVSGEQAFQYIQEGKKEALSALKEFTDDLAMFLFNLFVPLDLEKILIGGGISEQPILMESLKKSIQDLKETHHDLKQGIVYPLPEVDVCKFHNDANLLGALYHFLYE